MSACPQKQDAPPTLSWRQHFEKAEYHHDLSQKHRKEAARLREADDHSLAAIHAGLAEEHLIKATTHVSRGIRGAAEDNAAPK